MPQSHSIGEEGVQLDIYKASQTTKSIDENTFLLELNKLLEKGFISVSSQFSIL